MRCRDVKSGVWFRSRRDAGGPKSDHPMPLPAPARFPVVLGTTLLLAKGTAEHLSVHRVVDGARNPQAAADRQRPLLAHI